MINFIYVLKQAVVVTDPIFTKFALVDNVSSYISCTKFHENPAKLLAAATMLLTLG